MTTKLVYVLTCAAEKYYIEQALMAVCSARHWNPDAHIVLVVDNNTDKLLEGKRAEIMKYVSEKKVVVFEDKNTTPMYRSRWLKTSVRDLVDGDFLFVDCDTVCQCSLSEADGFSYQIAMVPDGHQSVKDYNDGIKSYMKSNAELLGYDVFNEELYFNSGVIYAKDTDQVRDFWRCWHSEWITGQSKGVQIDQSALGKANLLFKHIIERLPDEWNTLVYMNPLFMPQGKILHFWGFRNKSFVFSETFLDYVQKNGINDYVKKSILSPSDTVLPFDNILFKASFKERLKMIGKIRDNLVGYTKNIEKSLDNNPWRSSFTSIETGLIKIGLFYLAAFCYILRRCLFLHNKKDRKREVYYS